MNQEKYNIRISIYLNLYEFRKYLLKIWQPKCKTRKVTKITNIFIKFIKLNYRTIHNYFNFNM